MLKMINRIVAFSVMFCLVFEQSGFAQVAPDMNIPAYLNGLVRADKFRPMHMRWLSYDPINNSFDLAVERGDDARVKEADIKRSTAKIMEYFQIGLRLPDSMFWVNLRPDAADQIIDPYLARTDLGKIMLEADLQLKKDLARFTSPDTKDGREYWNKLYARAEQLFGAEGLTIPAVTRPWIVPNEIIIKEYKDGAYVYKATMKVMLEQDYLKDAPGYTFDDPRMKELNEYSSELVRQLIIPQLTREVNSSKRYSGLRQVFYSLVLSQWFKQRYAKRQGQQGSAVTDMIDSRDLSGLTSAAAWSKDIYFNQYVQSFKKGEYNKQETVNGLNGITIRQYFSGGILFRLQQGVEAMGRNAPLMTILPAAAEASPERSLPVRVLGNSSEYNLGFNGARLKIHVLEHADLRADTVEQPQKNDGGDAQEETIDWKKRMQRLLMLEIASIVLTTGSMLGFFFSVFYFPHAAALVSTYFGTITGGIAWQELDKKREDAERKRQIAEQPYSPAIKAFLSVPPQYRSAILSAQDHVYGYWRVLEILRDMRYADPDPEIASALEAILHKPYSLAQKLRNVYLVFANLVWFELTVKLQVANILKKYYSQNDPGRVSAFLEENFELLSELMNQASVRAWWDKIFDERFFQREMIASARLMAELYGRDYLLLHTGDFNDEAVYFIQTALWEMNAYDRTLAGADSRKDGGYGLSAPKLAAWSVGSAIATFGFIYWQLNSMLLALGYAAFAGIMQAALYSDPVMNKIMATQDPSFEFGGMRRRDGGALQDIDSLLADLKSDNKVLRDNAIDGLSGSRDPRAVTALGDLLLETAELSQKLGKSTVGATDPSALDQKIRESVSLVEKLIKALAKTRNERASDYLLKAYNFEYPGFAFFPNGTGVMGGPGWASSYWDVLIPAQIIKALGRTGGAQALYFLMERAQDGYPVGMGGGHFAWIPMAAIEGLAMIGDKKALPFVRSRARAPFMGNIVADAEAVIVESVRQRAVIAVAEVFPTAISIFGTQVSLSKDEIDYSVYDVTKLVYEAFVKNTYKTREERMRGVAERDRWSHRVPSGQDVIYHFQEDSIFEGLMMGDKEISVIRKYIDVRKKNAGILERLGLRSSRIEAIEKDVMVRLGQQGQQRDGGEDEIRPWSKEYFSAPEFLNRQINLAQKKQSLGRLLKVFMGLTVAAVGAVIVHALIIPGTKLSNIVFVGLCAYVAIVAAVMIYESRIALSEPDILPSELVRWIQEQVQDPFVPRYISAATLSMYVTHQPKLILHKEDRGFGNYDRVLYAYPGQGAERQISSAKYNAIIQSIENYFAAMQDVVKNHWFSRYGPKKGEMMEKYLEKQQDFYFYRKAYARRPYIREINRYHVHTLNYDEKREFESLRYQGRDTGPFLEKIFDRNVRDIFSRYDQARQDAGAGIQKDGGLAVQAENAMADSQYVLLVLNGISEIQNRRGTKYALTGEEWKKAIAAVLHSLSVIGLDRLLEVRNNIEPSGLSDAQKFILDRAIDDLTTAQALSKVDAGEDVVSGKDGGIVELSQMIRDNFTAMTINEYNAAYAQLESYLRNLNAQLKERGIAMQDYVTIGDAMKALKDDRVLKLLNKKNFAFITRLTGPLVDIVDASGQTVTQTQEWVAHMFGLPHRVAYALVIGPNDEVVFQRLAHGRVEAGSLAAFGSHVEPGADEKETVRRELMKDLRLQALKGRLLPLGKAGQFTYDVKMTNVEDKWLNNNEYRALFAYFLTQEEFEWIRRDRNEMVRDRSLMAFEEFVQSGLWPVRNYAIVSFDALKKAAAEGKHAFYMEEDYVDRAESGRVAFNSILEGIVISQARNDTASLTVLDELQELLDKEKAAGLSITERLKGKLSSKLSSVKDRIRPQSDTSQLQRDGGATEKRIREIVELLNILRKENIILENELASAGPAEANGIRERIATNRHLIEQLTEELEAKQEYLRNLPPAQIWAQGRIVQGRKYYIKGAPEELRELYGSERPVFEVEGLYEGPLMEGQKGYFFTGHVYQGNLRISAVVSIDDLEEIPDEDADALDGGMPVADRYRAVDHAGQVKSEAGARSSSSTASGDSTADNTSNDLFDSGKNLPEDKDWENRLVEVQDHNQAVRVAYALRALAHLAKNEIDTEVDNNIVSLYQKVVQDLRAAALGHERTVVSYADGRNRKLLISTYTQRNGDGPADFKVNNTGNWQVYLLTDSEDIVLKSPVGIYRIRTTQANKYKVKIKFLKTIEEKFDDQDADGRETEAVQAGEAHQDADRRAILLQQIKKLDAAVSDGGKDQPATVGGVDFRAIPAVVVPAVGGVAGAVVVNIQDFDRQWNALQKKVADGQMPYDDIRAYIAACCANKEACANLKKASLWISEVLKMEEDACVESSAKMKELIAIL